MNGARLKIAHTGAAVRLPPAHNRRCRRDGLVPFRPIHLAQPNLSAAEDCENPDVIGRLHPVSWPDPPRCSSIFQKRGFCSCAASAQTKTVLIGMKPTGDSPRASGQPRGLLFTAIATSSIWTGSWKDGRGKEEDGGRAERGVFDGCGADGAQSDRASLHDDATTAPAATKPRRCTRRTRRRRRQ